MSSSSAWIDDSKLLEIKLNDVSKKINSRSALNRRDSQYHKISSEATKTIESAKKDLSSLKNGLLHASSKRLLPGELDRRQVLLDQAAAKCKLLEQSITNPSTFNDDSRRDLLRSGARGTTAPSSSRDPWEADEDEQEGTKDLNISQLRQRQQDVIDVQDKGIEALSHAIGRQKAMALDINVEVGAQNELLDDITDAVDRTDNRVKRETRHVKIVTRKASDTFLWVMIVLLLIAIIVVSVVPS